MKICEYIESFPPSEEPLSADVFFVRGVEKTYIFDVGASDEAFEAIQSVKGEKAVILSHFHPDHTKNMERIDCKEVYLGRATFKKLGRGTIVDSSVKIDDGVCLEIIRLPSVHAKGSLVLKVNSEYTLLGDLCYAHPDANRPLAIEMITALKKLDTKYFVQSHEEKVYKKDEFIAGMEEWFLSDKNC